MKADQHIKLGQFFATAISGNDILSSALYVSGIAAIFAGAYAPIVLLAVAVVLFFYRTVYREVVEALPVNGGAYNALLNGTSKTLAATAGVMTILSYIATAVISAKTAVEYLFKLVEHLFLAAGNVVAAQSLESIVTPAVILVLLAFALLVISGVKDSAKVAAGIFGLHVFTLIAFILLGLVSAINGHSLLAANIATTADVVASHGGLPQTLFFAFAACLLGVSGFESSANFVEEQKPGVFRKTLRNMLIGVAVFNPLIAVVLLNTLPLDVIVHTKDFVLAEAALGLGGTFTLGWMAINAFLVLSGAVLTSYVGVSGLINRMSLDDCLPRTLSIPNQKGSYPAAIIAFFLLCTSILIITKGNLLSLAGVYTISFLGVMTLFALGNLILRQTRTELKRPYTAPFVYVITAFFSTAIGLYGNILIDRTNIAYFLMYFVPAVSVVYGIIYKKDAVDLLIRLTSPLPFIHATLKSERKKIINTRFYVFIHHHSRLFGILEYISRNENSHNITLVHCCRNTANDPEVSKIAELIPHLQEAGVYPEFNITVETLRGEFGPEILAKYTSVKKINRNKVFIGSIHHHHNFTYDDLGGVRIISQ